MSDNAIRGVGLLVAAGIALLVLVANAANDGPAGVTTVASAVLVIGGAVGLVLLAVAYVRGRR